MAKSLAPVATPAVWAEPSAVVAFLQDTAAITEVELRKVMHDPTELVMRAAQPVLWLLIFGEVMASTRAIATGGLPYLDFLAPGILAQSALFSAIFYGITVVWERDLGIVQRYLVTPASRAALVSAKALAAGLRALSQAFIVYVLALILGVHAILDPLRLLGVGVAVVLGSAAFAMFSLSIASLVKSRERVMGIGQLLTMPLFFASSAIYPVASMPTLAPGSRRRQPAHVHGWRASRADGLAHHRHDRAGHRLPALSASRSPCSSRSPRSSIRASPSDARPVARPLSFASRARRGTSGALYLQSAPAGLNSLPRPAFADAAERSTLRTGSRAAATREPRQVRKEAALNAARRVPRIGLVRAGCFDGHAGVPVDGGCTALLS